MSYVIPVQRVSEVRTISDVVDVQIPEWMLPSLKLSYYLHFFRGDLKSLPNDMVQIQDNYSDFKTNLIAMPLKGLPQDISTDWLLQQVKDTLKQHQAQILHPATDITIYKETLVIFLDGWHPLKPQEPPQIEDSDDEQPKKEEVKQPEIPPLTHYNCASCTFENPVRSGRCEICESPRPPMPVLEEEWRRKHEPKKEEPVADAEEAPTRLQALSKDLK